MLSASRTPIGEVLPLFLAHGVDVAFLVPTETGLRKSILDATATFREFLLRNGVHDYATQLQGPANKKLLEATLIGRNGFAKTEASLYRPVTKQGDPRIWFRGLKGFAEPRDLLGIATDGRALFVFNLSHPEVRQSLANGGWAAEVLRSLALEVTGAASQLLGLLRRIGRRGFIPSAVCGDTGVGVTLERELGIPPNCSERPDFGGIELKAYRSGRVASTITLFSKRPDWTKSRLGSRDEVLDAFGYERDGRKALYCTLSAAGPNSQGLMLDVDERADVLHALHRGDGRDSEVVLWPMAQLRARLVEKHTETFWVEARVKREQGREFFRYEKVTYTKHPSIAALPVLLGTGGITVDFLLHRKPGHAVRDHGWLFRLDRRNFDDLFITAGRYDLTK